MCYETTAREAMVRDFRAFFLSDETTTGGVEGLSHDEVQRAALGVCFTQALTVDGMIQKIKTATAITCGTTFTFFQGSMGPLVQPARWHHCLHSGG